MPSNLLTEWSRLLIGTLARAGVREAIISPGSRSTPFAWAALKEPQLRCTNLVDERSAAFFALGQAKISGRASLLICTSGSAGSHYYPAVIEASLSRTPLLVLTADRPPDLQGCGAPQTIDQTRLFGEHCREFFDLGLPDSADGALRSLRRRIAQAVAATSYPMPGAVHLNAPARKPLEPCPPRAQTEIDLQRFVTTLLDHAPSISLPRTAPDPTALASLAERCRNAARGLIVCGPQPPTSSTHHAILRLASASGFPLLCEATSQVRFRTSHADPSLVICDSFDRLFQTPRFRESFISDLLLQIGPPPTSAGYDSYLTQHPEIPRHILAAQGVPDPPGSAVSTIVGDIVESADGLARLLEAPLGETPWQERVGRANLVAWSVVESELSDQTTLGEGEAVRIAVESAPRGSILALGNSLAIRHVDGFCPARDSGLSVWFQRGANGIEGLISGAAGAAHGSGRGVTLIIGDISFLHDVSGLWAARHVTPPLVIVVIDNDGGRIFEQLPLASLDARDDANDLDGLESWLTPHGLDLTLAARFYGHPVVRASSADELRHGLEQAHSSAGCSVIVALVPPHGAAEQQKRLARSLKDALDGAAASEL